MIKSHKWKVKKKIDRDHYWYDTQSKIMYHGKGGRMEFVYRPDVKRVLPKIVDDEVWSNENNFPAIQEWLDRVSDDFGVVVVSKVPGSVITVDIPSQEFDRFSEELYRQKFVYDYDHREIQ